MSAYEELLGLSTEDTPTVTSDDGTTSSNSTNLTTSEIPVEFTRGALSEGATSLPASLQNLEGSFFLDLTNLNLWVDGKYCFLSTANQFLVVLLTAEEYASLKEQGLIVASTLYCIPETQTTGE